VSDSATGPNGAWAPIQHTESACPNCGYCPHCGRSNAPVMPWRPAPYYPAYPYWGVYPNYGPVYGAPYIGGNTAGAGLNTFT
jgi:hypothetical protein